MRGYKYTLKELIFSKNQDLEGGLLYEKRALFVFFRARSQLSSIISCKIRYVTHHSWEDNMGYDIVIEIFFPVRRNIFIQVKGRDLRLRVRGKNFNTRQAWQIYHDRGIEVFKVVTRRGRLKSVKELIPYAKKLLLSYSGILNEAKSEKG